MNGASRRKVGGILLAMLVTPLIVFFAVPPRLSDIPFSRAVYDRNGQLLRLTLASDQTFRLFTPLAHVSPLLTQAVLLREDRQFYHHPGVNPAALLKAAWRHLAGGGRGGASTITMQLARLIYGLHTRSISGKLWQMSLALRIELHYGKDAILEAYLNRAPYGGNIEGVGAASAIYFGQTPDTLSLPEALTLAAIPQSPAARTPGVSARNDAALGSARLREFAYWLPLHPQDARFASLLRRPMRYGSRRDLPLIAPQWTARLLREHTGNRLVTTLDAPTQRELYRLVQRYVQRRSDLGIGNAAALLVDTRDGSVAASVGSADYFNAGRQGMVDGTRARRSPGSALKPFIYALGFDEGIIHPRSLLADAPAVWGVYAPENYTRDYEGPLSAHDALIRSRNIPALWVDAQLTHPDFYHFLQSAQVGKLRKAETYGLTLALGGAEVTMEELTRLYVMLANDGVDHPLRVLANAPPGRATRLLSPEAAFLTLDILKDTPTPEGSSLSDTLPLPVYWKTGTSQGLRDAWSVGVFGHYALAVWTGDFRGGRRGQYVGILSAAPLFFELVRAVAGRAPMRDLIAAKAEGLKLRRATACADTGDIDLPYCAARVPVWIIPGVSPMRPTGIYRRVLVDRLTGELACRYTPDRTDYRVLQFWPSDLTQVFAKAGIAKPPTPIWQAGCTTQSNATGGAPRILSPVRGVSYRMQPGNSNLLPLKATLDGGAKFAFWFIGDTPAGRAGAGDTVYWPMHPGRYAVRVIDDAGRADSRMLTVE